MSFTMWATVVLFQSSYFYCNLKSVKSIIFPLNFPFKLSAIVVLCQSNLHFFMLFYQFNISRQVVVLYPHIFHSFPQLTKLFHWRESMWLKSIWNKIVLQNFLWCSVFSSSLSRRCTTSSPMPFTVKIHRAGPKLLLPCLTTIVLYFLTSGVNQNYPTEDLIQRNSTGTPKCIPAKNIGFLKIHKAAST